MSIALLLLVLPQAQASVERLLGAMGTSLVLEVRAETREQALSASETAVRAIEAVEARLSTWTPESELSAFLRAPAGEDVLLSEALAHDLALAQLYYELTQGAFDPGLGPLVRAYDLRGAGRWPSPSELERARGLSGWRHFRLDGRRAARLEAGAGIEEGGFGKGLALDEALERLRTASASAARIDLGGQIACFGASFALTIADPRERDRPVLALELERGSLATSGNSERGLVVDERPLGHILDPRSGLPAADHGSTSVLADSALAADCLATALYVLGPEPALAWLAEHPEYEAVLLLPQADGLVARATPKLRERLRILVPDLRLEP